MCFNDKSRFYAHIFIPNKDNEKKSVPHSLLWTSRSSVHPVLSFSTITPALSLTHSHTQQHTSSDTCFSGSFSLWRNLHLKWLNSHSRVQSASRSLESLKGVVYTHLLTFNHFHTVLHRKDQQILYIWRATIRQQYFYSSFSPLDIPDSSSSQNWESFVCRCLSLAHFGAPASSHHRLCAFICKQCHHSHRLSTRLHPSPQPSPTQPEPPTSPLTFTTPRLRL